MKVLYILSHALLEKGKVFHDFDESTKKIILRDFVDHESIPKVIIKRNLGHNSGIDIPIFENEIIEHSQVKRLDTKFVAIIVDKRDGVIENYKDIRVGDYLPYEVRPRSSCCKDGERLLLMTNSPGTIDRNYRGNLKTSFVNLNGKNQKLERNQSIAQICLPTLEPVDNVCIFNDPTMEQLSLFRDIDGRGEGGFGSTGK